MVNYWGARRWWPFSPSPDLGHSADGNPRQQYHGLHNAPAQPRWWPATQDLTWAWPCRMVVSRMTGTKFTPRKHDTLPNRPRGALTACNEASKLMRDQWPACGCHRPHAGSALTHMINWQQSVRFMTHVYWQPPCTISSMCQHATLGASTAWLCRHPPSEPPAASGPRPPAFPPAPDPT